MKKFYYLLFLIFGITACSVEPIDSTENLLTADAKAKIQQVEKSMKLKSSEICEGEAPVFTFNFPQNTTGNGLKDTDIQIQLLNPVSGEWEQFKKLSYAGAGPEEYTYTDAVLAIKTYNFRVSIGSGGFDYFASLNVVECSECEESFSYVANEDGSYTFTYIPSEDMSGAIVEFTLAQGVSADGLENFSRNGKDNASVWTSVTDLFSCATYEWTVKLTPDCSGNSRNSNVWTDFKVNEVSKKGELDNIIKPCLD